MPLSILFWVVYLIAIIFSYWAYYVPGQPFSRPFGGVLAIWLLVGILGWSVFGPVVR